MHLLIVESPNKIKKIKSFVGPDYEVEACQGHFRDLPTDEFGVAFRDGRVLPEYQVHKRDIAARLKDKAKRADSILLATDPDREGEAIAWHLTELLGRRQTYRRVTFHAITKDAVQQALAAPRPVDLNLVNAQQARRILDRAVGYIVSPLLWSHLGQNRLSAGRVQSVALRLVVERERAISGFVPRTYFTPVATFRANQPPLFNAKLAIFEGKPFKDGFGDEPAAARLVAQVKAAGGWSVSTVESREREVVPPAPFITSTVQQAASVKLGLNPAATMKLLQSLFEEGRITYHRTDSPALSPEGLTALRSWIGTNLPPEFLPKDPRQFAAKGANAQEAHEAIRPTHVEDGPDCVQGDAAGLYRLIWERAVASQMAAGRDRVVKVSLIPDGIAGVVFAATGKTPIFAGWRKLTERDSAEDPDAAEKDGDDEDRALPPLAQGDKPTCTEVLPGKSVTKPPGRYTEASLIKDLEAKGIGRPSTYAAIIDRILKVGYVGTTKRHLHATDLGMRVCDYLAKTYAAGFIEIAYTKEMEDRLDRVAAGTESWEKVVGAEAESIQRIASANGLATNYFAGESGKKLEAAPGVECPQCGKGMALRTGKNGPFYGCLGYPKCKGTRPGPGQSTGPDAPKLVDGLACPHCGKGMLQINWNKSSFLRCEVQTCPGRLNSDGTWGKDAHAPVNYRVRCPICQKATVHLHNALKCVDRECKGVVVF